MSQLFPKSILLDFPSEIYLRRGVGELFPLLVRALHENEIVAMQFLRVGGRTGHRALWGLPGGFGVVRVPNSEFLFWAGFDSPASLLSKLFLRYLCFSQLS